MNQLPDGSASRRLSFVLLIGALGVALQTFASFAQSQQPPPPQRPTFRTEANFVRVDVFATAGEAPVLDLRQQEFQVFEDGALQTVESFEHVLVRRDTSQTGRIEPNTVREANTLAADPHNRVFVVFLDGNHVSFTGAASIAGPLTRLIDRILAPDDLLGLMTPTMAASDITLARKTDIIERGLQTSSLWGRRGRITDLDEVEESYVQCYPLQAGERGSFSAVAREMILRRREKATLDAMMDTVRHLNALREDRKAIVVISEGWTLFRPGSALLEAAKPVPPQIFVSPRGTLTTTDERNATAMNRSACDQDRLMLGALDDERYYHDVIREAQDANVGFYPVDPRGLVVFDTDLGGLEQPLGPIADAAQLRSRLEALRTLAVATDGIAVVDSNDIDRGLKKVSDDLSSYYLLGYYSTNGKLDGSYRQINVKVTRAGVKIRARRGYRASSAEDLAKAARADEPATLGGGAFEAAVSREVGTLSAVRPTERLYLRGVLVSGGGAPQLWLAGELSESFVRAPGGANLVRQGASVRLVATSDRDETVGAGRATIEAGARSFLTRFPLDRADGVREIRVRIQIGGGLPDGERVDAQLAVPVPDVSNQLVLRPPLLYRGSTRASVIFEPAACPQFRRAETLRAESPLVSNATAPAARLLDRTGKPLALPLTVTERRDDATGGRWLVAEVALAPLGPGDYVLALSAEQGTEHQEVLAAFRVVR